MWAITDVIMKKKQHQKWLTPVPCLIKFFFFYNTNMLTHSVTIYKSLKLTFFRLSFWKITYTWRNLALLSKSLASWNRNIKKSFCRNSPCYSTFVYLSKQRHNVIVQRPFHHIWSILNSNVGPFVYSIVRIINGSSLMDFTLIFDEKKAI